jgi:hypothetical protein
MRRLAVVATLAAVTVLLVLPASARAEGIISSLSVSPPRSETVRPPRAR